MCTGLLQRFSMGAITLGVMSACFSAIPRASAQPAVDFKTPEVFNTTLDEPQEVAVGNFLGGDDYPDVAVANKATDTEDWSITVYQNSQDWSPTADGLDEIEDSPLLLNQAPTRIELADMGEASDDPAPDGLLDIVVLMPYDVYGSDPQVAIFYQTGGGSFSSPHYIALDGNTTDAMGLALNDLDRDGRIDIGVAAMHGHDSNARPHTEILWRESNGSLTGQVINVPSISQSSQGTDVTLGRFYKHPTVIGTPAKDIVMGIETLSTPKVFLLINNQDRTFTTSTYTAKDLRLMDAGKLRSGNDLDLVGTEFDLTTSRFYVIKNDYVNGTFTYDDEYNPTEATESYGITIGKINRDGYNDVVVALPASTYSTTSGLCYTQNPDFGHGGIAVYVGNNDATFDEPPYYFCTRDPTNNSPPKPCFVTIDDMDQDGLKDVVCSNTDDDQIAVLINESPAP